MRCLTAGAGGTAPLVGLRREVDRATDPALPAARAMFSATLLPAVERPFASSAPCLGKYASQIGAVQGNSPRSPRTLQVPRSSPRAVSIGR